MLERTGHHDPDHRRDANAEANGTCLGVRDGFRAHGPGSDKDLIAHSRNEMEEAFVAGGAGEIL